ncbi:spore germination protein GerPB [Halalkalibacter krulwichiae]|uniref:Putative spore germination protein GerPB n=1 Tax=Halalkalibacter krulwichiae TaxID=199441 RepID=A0A1X9M9I7_9BACI|nr:spore germination protein GerPB [Halalkalibacter krulwichiae]ARK30066.1 putative spore germination protein GerPB [Halalkalibacter krulwichiae]
MNFFINQSINIQSIRINGLSNSSVLQIGSAGMIKALSNNYNTGGFTEPAPEAGQQATVTEALTPAVPLAPASV